MRLRQNNEKCIGGESKEIEGNGLRGMGGLQTYKNLFITK